MMRSALALVSALTALGPVHAQDYPTQPIRVVIPYAPGGGTDVLARPLAQELGERLKQPVIVDNKPGAGGNIGAQLVAKAQPDGYTLLFANNSHAINPFLYRTPGYDLANDFAPITLAATSPLIVVVHRSSPIGSMAELIAHARKNPGKLNFGSAGTGTPGHLAPLLFMRQAGVDIVHVPYKGSGPTTTALLAKEVELAFATPAAVEQQIRAGELRPLAVTSRERFPAFPDVPTIAEIGGPALADYGIEIWWGLLAPAKTDPKVLDKLHEALAAAIGDPKMQQRWLGQGMVPRITSRQEFQQLIRADLAKWEKVVRENRITVE